MEIQYRATIILPHDETCPVEQINAKLIECLKAVHPDKIGTNEWEGAASRSDSDDSLGDVHTAFWNGWGLHVHVAAEPYVAQELQEWASLKSFEPPCDVVTTCTRRVELWTDDDTDMIFFNNYVALLAEIEDRFEGALLLDEAGNTI
jgi:hypothetical protein